MSASIAIPEVLPAIGLNLTLREKSLVDYYLQIKVRWKAAKLAGYSGNMQTLASTAYDTLKKPEVAAYYAERLRELHISSDELLAEFSEVVKTPLDAKTQKRTGVRVADKLKAGETLGKWLGMEKTDTELTFSDSDLARLSESLVNGLIEVARRRREQALALPAGDTPNGE